MSFLSALASGSASYGRFRADTNIIFFSSFACVMCIVAAWMLLQPDPTKAIAKIKSVECTDDALGTTRTKLRCDSVVEFPGPDGKPVKGTITQLTNVKPEVGSDLEIAYDPSNPSTSISTMTWSLRLIGLVVCVLTVCSFGCVILQRQMVNQNSTYASLFGATSAISDITSMFRR